MKTASRFTHVLATASLVGMVATGTVLATDTIAKVEQPKTQSDGHIKYHQFEHEINSYPGVSASFVKRNGTLTLLGRVNDGIDKQRIERLAKSVRGVVEVRNQVNTD